MATRAGLAQLLLHGLLYDKPASLTPPPHRRAHRLAQVSLAIAVALFVASFHREPYDDPGPSLLGIHFKIYAGRFMFYNSNLPYLGYGTTVFLPGTTHTQIYNIFLHYRGVHVPGRPTGWTLAVEILPLVAVALIWPVTWTAVLLRRWRRITPGVALAICPNCGYDLRATPARCPECGHAIGPSPTSHDSTFPTSTKR